MTEIMEYYEVFMKVILKEVAKFNLNIDVYSTRIAQLTAALDESFDIPYNRCAYMYRYGTVLTHFFNDCIKNFFSSYSLIQDIFSKWKSYSEVKVCSLSTGPGLDYIGFMLALLEFDSLPPNFEVKVLSKHGAWRNTRNLILEVFNDTGSGSEFSKKPLQYQNLKVVQLDFLWKYSFGNATAVSEANVILMMKTLNLLAPGTPQEGCLLQMFKEFVASLKPETLIFCLDTKPSIAVLTQAILYFPGKFLYGPILHTAQLPPTFPEFNGHHPTLSARGVFFVWQKLPDSLLSNESPSPSHSSFSCENTSIIDIDKIPLGGEIDLYSDTCENTSSSKFSPFDLDKIPIEREIDLCSDTCENTSSGIFSPLDLNKVPAMGDYQKLDEENSKKTVMPKESLKPFLSLKNKSIQTDVLLDRTTAPSSVTALIDRIRQLTISLDSSAAQQNDSSSGDFFSFTQPNERRSNHSYCNDKPSSSKQSHNMGFTGLGSSPSHHTCRNAPCQNMGSHYSCHCSHNRCMNCGFQPCCSQPILGCSFSCHHQSAENDLPNAASPNIVIPLQNISDNVLLQIISILKSESKA